MFRLSTLLFFLVMLGLSVPLARAGATPPVTFRAALELWRLVTPESQVHLFDDIIFLPVTGDNAPLARYTPKDKPTIEIGQNMRRYKNEYIYLSSDQDMSTKPDFDQYMTVLMTLSLANESAHHLQDQNGSLKDFYKLYNAHQLNKACALYSLQQHVSDIVMLKTGMSLEQLFLGQGSVKGINALRIALEKNNLRDEFEDFRNAMNKHDTSALDDILRRIRNKRNDANMSGLHLCPPYGDAVLDDDILNRATEPAGYPFQKKKKSFIDKLF
jgi:hypothetical protein